MRMNRPSAVEEGRESPARQPMLTNFTGKGFVSRALMVLGHYPYYIRLFSRLPFGVYRRVTRSKCRDFSVMESFLAGKKGLEIGGPSPFFDRNGLVPIYGRCRELDNCNFAPRTIWTSPAGQARPGAKFHREIVAEACDLSTIPDASYDFVIASHVLEHLANPLRALLEWRRLLRISGVLLIVVPDKRNTFDHKRPFTSFEHIHADFAAGTEEDDLTHLDEVLALHDLRLDPLAGSRQQFHERCLQNAKFRAIHHHVFTSHVLALMLKDIDMRVLSLTTERPAHIIGFALKANAGAVCE